MAELAAASFVEFMLNPDERRSVVAVVLLLFRVNALNVLEAGIYL